MKKNLRTRRAFTMIELLVVIAIIAILAAILFPVFATVREQARQSSTMSNMQAVYVGAKLYNEDEGHYPSVLFGYAEAPATGVSPPYLPVTMANKGVATAMHNIAGTFRTAGGSVLAGYLYHEQIKDYVTFLAGDDAITDQTDTTLAYYPPSTQNGSMIPVTWKTNGKNTDGCTSYGDADLPTGFKGDGSETKIFYKMDAMDISPMIDGNGKVVKDPNDATKIAYELHYTPDWTRELWQYQKCDIDTNTLLPLTAQLKYKNPPSDHTVLTYVTSHVAFGNSAKVMVLLLSGTVKKMEAKDAVNQLPLKY